MDDSLKAGEPLADLQVKLFRPAYVLMPVSLLVLTVVGIAVFFSQLPEMVAFTFDGDGVPTRTAGRAALVFWLIVINVLCTVTAFGLTRTIAWAYNEHFATAQGSRKPDSMIILMGNELGIMQAVAFFAMVDIFSYNLYGTNLLPLWQIALIVLAAGGIFIAIFTVRYLIQSRF